MIFGKGDPESHLVKEKQTQQKMGQGGIEA